MTRASIPSLIESLGLRPFSERLRQAAVALRGGEDLPPSRFDRTSLSMLNPRVSLPLWAGRPLVLRQVILTNLFNHRQTPPEEGWSVCRSGQAEDFRGRKLTYDSHNGTDLSVPRGTLAVAPAAGTVARVYSEFNRGGNKVVIDHGEGLLTCSAHLARVLVDEGDVLLAGQPYAVPGYSGLDGFSTFPWGVPHIHFNVWLNGVAVDPFARGHEPSLWVGGQPTPAPGSPLPPGQGNAEDEPAPRTAYDTQRVDAAIDAGGTPSVRLWLRGIDAPHRRASYLTCERCYYPTRFSDRDLVQAEQHPRRPRLHLPFSARDIDGAVFLDELSHRGLVLP